MKYTRADIYKANLRLNQLKNQQAKSTFKQKSFSNNRIIKERANSFTEYINNELDKQEIYLSLYAILDRIDYHIKFYQTQQPIGWDKTKVKDWIIRQNELLDKLNSKEINVKQFIQGLEEIDKEIVELIQNWGKSL